MMESIINQRLNFDEMSCDEEEDNSSEATNSSNSGLLRKKLNFDFVDNCDLDDYHVDNEDDEEEMYSNAKKCEANGHSHNQVMDSSFHSTPSKTRSGRIYAAAIAAKAAQAQASSSVSSQGSPANAGSSTVNKKSKLPTPDLERPRELNLLQKDLHEAKLEAANGAPPPLNYSKRPVSRIRFPGMMSPASEPINSPSPPTNEVRAMRLFDDTNTSPVSVPKLSLKSKLFDQNRRISAPPAVTALAFGDSEPRKRKRVSNINPFTPVSIWASMRKKARMTSGESSLNNDGSFEKSPHVMNAHDQQVPSNEICISLDEAEHTNDGSTSSAKRLKISDINISRYEQEFVEIKEIASGTFGTVKVARHRLDGMVYAIKVTRNKIHGNTHEERVAMNEVFAHSALIKHKHVVRYYNSWVENGRVYIQNEFCEGGSLAAKIREFKETGKRFTEAELKRILLHLAKGLDYIHSKFLVHLDVKPENIFISLDYPVPSPQREASNPKVEKSEKVTKNNVKEAVATSTEEELFSGNESTDSGHHSGSTKFTKIDSNSSSPVDDRVSYKIGDLGHVAQVHGDSIPEEGDCRYMAPELLEMHIDREMLAKADIFSLGLTLFEAASLKDLPKNSLEDQEYEKLKAGQLPYLDGYSKDFNNLLKAMVHPDPRARPSANKLASLQTLRGTNSSNNKSRSQLYQELKETKAKLRLLEQQLGQSGYSPSMQPEKPKSKLVGRGCARSKSFGTTKW